MCIHALICPYIAVQNCVEKLHTILHLDKKHHHIDPTKLPFDSSRHELLKLYFQICVKTTTRRTQNGAAKNQRIDPNFNLFIMNHTQVQILRSPVDTI
jgi:hypothetical protein